MLRSELLRRVAEVECEGYGASWQDVWSLEVIAEAKSKEGNDIGI